MKELVAKNIQNVINKYVNRNGSCYCMDYQNNYGIFNSFGIIKTYILTFNDTNHKIEIKTDGNKLLVEVWKIEDIMKYVLVKVYENIYSFNTDEECEEVINEVFKNNNYIPEKEYICLTVEIDKEQHLYLCDKEDNVILGDLVIVPYENNTQKQGTVIKIEKLKEIKNSLEYIDMKIL